MSAFVDFYFHLAIDGRNLDRTTQNGSRQWKQKVVNQVVVVANQLWVFFFFNHYQQIAIHAAVSCSVAFAAHRQLHAFGYAGRYFDGDYFVAAHYAFAAMRTFIGNDLAFAAAYGTRSLCLHLTKNGALDLGYIARSVAIGTCFGVSVARAGAVAMRACHVFADFDFFLGAGGYFGQCQFDFHPQVAAFAHTPSATRTAAAKEIAETAAAKAKMAAENVAEMLEYVIHVHTAGSAKSAVAAHACMPELVVTCALVGVAQHLVCLGGLLKFLFGHLVARIFVGVKLDGFFAVSLFYLVGRRSFRYAKHFVIISFFHDVTELKLSVNHWPTTTLGNRMTLSFI